MTQQESLHARPAFITAQEAGTLPGLFQSRARRTPHTVAYRQFAPAQGCWQEYSWQGMAKEIARWQAALLAEGLQPGERVALWLKNSVEWVCMEQAALALQLVVVPLYSLDLVKNIAFILDDSGASILLVGEPAQWQALAPLCTALPRLRLVLLLADEVQSCPASGPPVRRIADWLPAKGGELVNQATDPHTLATLIYTSGTTGPPKGVMLSHHNILWNGEAVLKVVPALASDIFLSFLPLSHAFERTVGYYVPMLVGAQVAFARSAKDLAEDLLATRPTVLISVPRIYERAYGRVHETARNKGKLAEKLLAAAVATGWRRSEVAQGRAPSPTMLQRLAWPLLHRLVGRKVLARFGGRIRVAVSGGAPLHEKVARLFIGLGLPLLQGYGLTESAPVVSANTLADNLPASVGKALPGVEVRLGPDNELLIRSPSVMLGYWDDAEKSREAITPDGWLHTGDLAQIADGRLFIRGRLKEILVTSTAEKIAPADLEAALTEDPLFHQAMVVGEGKPYLAALIVLDRQGWQQLAATLRLAPADPASLQSQAATTAVLNRTRKILAGFPAQAEIRAVHLSLKSWSYEEGLVTPLLKLRRNEIANRFAKEIAALYTGHNLT